MNLEQPLYVAHLWPQPRRVTHLDDPKGRKSNPELPVSCDEIYVCIRICYSTDRKVGNYRRGADTTAARYAERIYQPGSSLLPLESDTIKYEKAPWIKMHVTDIHYAPV